MTYLADVLGNPATDCVVPHTNFSKRDLFAAMAMQGLLADGAGSVKRLPETTDVLAAAKMAVESADALLAELAK